MRSPEELKALEEQMGGSLPPSQYPQPEQTAHYAWYGTAKRFPDHLLQAWVLCRRCDQEGLRDGQVRYAFFEEHLLAVHGLSPKDYSHRYEHTEFAVWHTE